MLQEMNKTAHIIEKIQDSLYKIHGSQGLESAFAIDKHHILTVAHAVGESSILQNREGETIESTLVGLDPRLDIALFKTVQELHPLEKAKPDHTKVGNMVFTIGLHAKSTSPRLSWGFISRLGGEWLTRKGARINQYIEVDATLPWGSSGGPLINIKGQYLGLNTHALVKGGATMPLQTLEETVVRIKEHGSITPGWLGVRVQEIELPKDIKAMQQQDTGMLILSRSWNGVARKEGIKVGDILLSANGISTQRFIHFRSAISSAGGKSIPITILRAGEILNMDITLPLKKSKGRCK